MPFTISHAAAIILVRKWKIRISSTGFIAGSMVPDFESFLLLRNSNKFSHTLPGIFLLALPLGILLCFWYHYFAKDYIFQILPLYYKNKVAKYMSFNWSKYSLTNKLLIVKSLLLGIISHLIWDDFTHENGFMVMHIPGLLYNIEWLRYKPLFFVIQILSSVVGLLFINNYICQLDTVNINGTTNNLTSNYVFILITALIVFNVRIYVLTQANTTSDLIKAAIGCLFYAVTICGMKELFTDWKKSLRT